MSSNADLAGLVTTLSSAAGPGAKRIASSVIASGNVDAKVGISKRIAPGPGLLSILGGTPGGVGVDPTRVPVIADHMAHQAANEAAALLSGKD